MTRNEMNGRTAAEQTINGKNGDGRFVGYAVGANCFSGISQTRARAEAEDLGIADDLIFPRLKSANYYRRAVVAAVSAGRTDERKFTAVKVEDTTKRIVHAIIRKDIVSGLIGTGAIVADASGELRINSNDAIFGEEFKVQFDKEAFEKGKQPEDLVTYEDRAKEHPVATAIGSLYTSYHGHFKSDDIRQAFSRAFRRWHAVPLLDHAGMWFVPASQEANVLAWFEWMKRIGCQPLALRQYAGADRMTDESIERSSSTGITNQLAALEKELDGFAAADSTRFSTLEERVGRFAELRHLVALHDELLGIRREKLAARLVEAQTRWMDKLIEIAEAEEPEDDDDDENPDEVTPGSAGGCI